ncbi:hypothetical protein ACFYY1_39045 [Streptomyces sp. NPDC001890]|uniref:hypothetical protein n=1 Tax=Streptomyces sp. NPDC001890 TaxID=3364620 RepID=UPI0036CC2E65
MPEQLADTTTAHHTPAQRASNPTHELNAPTTNTREQSEIPDQAARITDDEPDDGMACPHDNRPPECSEIDPCEPCAQDEDAEAEEIERSMGLRSRTTNTESDHADNPGLITYRVTAYGIAHTAFTYLVTAPRGARDVDIASEAYGRHGLALQTGRHTEPLGPVYTVDTPADQQNSN